MKGKAADIYRAAIPVAVPVFFSAVSAFFRCKRERLTNGDRETMKPNHRMTRQRKLILEELRKSAIHPSAEEIFESVRRRLPRISLATVYRNLEILSQLGEIQQLHYGGTLKRFDGDPNNHYHVRCTCCGRIDHAPLDSVKEVEHELQAETNYKILGHRLEFVGLCPDCSKHMIAPGLKKSEKI
jgi:Fur family ferric uptake transcriptional regulator